MRTLKGCQIQLCDPFRVEQRFATGPEGIAKRSTPGYYLAALQAALGFFRNSQFLDALSTSLRNHVTTRK
jgi:hypothetical protein